MKDPGKGRPPGWGARGFTVGARGFTARTRGFTAKARGFTLIELMLTITVAAILLAVAVPSFENITDNSALHDTAADLITAIHTARVQAVNQRAPVTLKANGAWSQGWTITFTAANSVDKDQTFTPAHGVTVDEKNSVDTLVFQPSGLVSTTATFKVCDGRTNETGQRISLGRFGTVDNQSFTCN